MIEGGPFVGLERASYRLIYADPPWRFKSYSDKGLVKSPQAHYPCMKLEDIQALPVADLAARDCALVMWTTQAMVPQALDVVKAWGFEFKSQGAWAKQSKTGRKWAFGTGHRFRSAAEFYYLCTRGEPRQKAKCRNLVVAPIREHSRKPDALRSDIETMFHGPYLELFAREQAPGWTAWGNQTGKFTHPHDLVGDVPDAA